MRITAGGRAIRLAGGAAERNPEGTHRLYVGVQFFVEAGALSNGKFHVVRASTMASIAGSTFANTNGIAETPTVYWAGKLPPTTGTG
jgi:hypothetical protein